MAGQALSEHDNASVKSNENLFGLKKPPHLNKLKKLFTTGHHVNPDPESPKGMLAPRRVDSIPRDSGALSNSSKRTPAFLTKNNSQQSKASRGSPKLQLLDNNKLTSSVNILKDDNSMSNFKIDSDSEGENQSRFNTDRPIEIADQSSGR